MARFRSFRRARPTHLLAGLALSDHGRCAALHTSPLAMAAAAAATPDGEARGDFNGDGFDDLAVSIPLANIDFVMQGAVGVIYGSATGLDPAGTPTPQFLTENSPNGPKELAGWGLSLTAGDFNDDGFGDLAVGAERLRLRPDREQRRFGLDLLRERGGPQPDATAYITAPTPTVGAQFGFFLAAADFNGDGRDDLAVNAINKAVAGLPVQELSSSTEAAPPRPAGWTRPGPPSSTKRAATSREQPEPGPVRPALAAGDLNGDGLADLAVGAPGRTVGGKTRSRRRVRLQRLCHRQELQRPRLDRRRGLQAQRACPVARPRPEPSLAFRWPSAISAGTAPRTSPSASPATTRRVPRAPARW